MKQLLRPANVVLFAQMVLVGLFLGQTGRLQPVLVPDTPQYTDFSWESPEDVLGSFRTPGYPAFLTAVAPGKNLAYVPLAHYVVYCLAVLLFAAGLKGLGIATWPRMWTASALLYTNILHGYVASIASDVLAASLAVAAVGLLFRSLHSRWNLLPLAVCSMAAWLVRPAYLSLVVLLPLLGMALLLSRRDDRPTVRQFATTAAALALVTMIPLFAYCSLRSAVVGRFGMVASGGLNLIGIAGQFLDEELVEALPSDVQPLAKHALSHPIPDDGDPSLLMNDAPVLNYQRIENRYDLTIWKVFYPAAEQTASSEVSSVNTRLRRLAQEIIRRRPTMYAVYLAKAFRRAVFKIVGDTVLNPYCLGLSLVIAGVVVSRILGRQGGRVRSEADGPALTGSGGTEHVPAYDLLSVIVLTTLTYAAFQMSVVILVCPPLGRMTDAMALFVPALLMAFLIDRSTLSRR